MGSKRSASAGPLQDAKLEVYCAGDDGLNPAVGGLQMTHEHVPQLLVPFGANTGTRRYAYS